MLKIKSYILLTISAGLTAFSGYALGLWIVDFLVRTHELSYSELTLPLALTIGVGGGVGTLFGGMTTDYFAKKDQGSYFAIPAYVHLISVPLFLAGMWVESSSLCFGIFFFVFALHASVAGPYYGLVQNLAPVNLRAFASALFFFILAIIGFGAGPVYIGILSDLLAPSLGDADALRWALTTLTPIWIIASLMMLLSRRVLIRDLSEADLEK